MDNHGCSMTQEEEFEHIDEWVSNPDVITMIANERQFFDVIKTLKATLSGVELAIDRAEYHAIPCPTVDAELLGIDISRELRLLGCSALEIKRWELVKKIERETGKRCDDYV